MTSKKETIFSATILSHQYLWETHYDCSKYEDIAYYVPSKQLVDLLKIHQTSTGVWKDQDNNVQMFDSRFDKSSANTSVKGLYVKKNTIEEAIGKDKTIIWLGYSEIASHKNSSISGDKRILKKVLCYLDNDGKFVHVEQKDC